MNQMRSLRFWIRSAVVILLFSCFSFYFLKDSVLTGHEIVMPEHEAVQGQDPSALDLQQDDSKASREPIRRTATLSQGDSTYAILIQNGISRSKAQGILSQTARVYDLSRVIPGHELVLVFSPDNRDLTGMEYEISEVSRLLVSIENDSVSASRQPVEKELPTVRGCALRQIDRIVGQGDSLFSILSSCGVDEGQVHEVYKEVKRVYNLSGLTRGNELSFWVTEGKQTMLARLTYEIDDRSILDVGYHDGSFHARKLNQEVSIRYERAEGMISSSLYESATQAGIPPEIIMGLTDIFAWDINFFTDVREGDTFQVLYERCYVRNTFKGYGRIIAARFLNQGQERVAVYYTDGKSLDGYFDETGKPIRKLFLKVPLNFRRMSAGFSLSRMHPVLHDQGHHLGVDYAAPAGTPVVSLGPGRILYKGRSKGLGKCIQVEHPSGYITYYGHLSGFAQGLSSGEAVAQGEVIGYVGMTGYATSPHLDFRVRQNGKFINPLKLKPVDGPSLKGSTLAHFRQLKAKRLAMLDDVSLNYTMKLSTRN
jgi:murein DD-endopeptidase MepM/ murein hydrolase activator NlpD